MTKQILSRIANGGGAIFLISLSLSTIFFQLQAGAFNYCPSSFHGTRLINPPLSTSNSNRRTATLVMRKQKASDRRTARMQRGNVDNGSLFTPPSLATATQILTSTPMTNSEWKHKTVDVKSSRVGINDDDDDDDVTTVASAGGGGGRGRARKRLKLYNSLASYHSTFLELISEEYQMEVS